MHFLKHFSFSSCCEKRIAKYQRYMLFIMVACRCQYGSVLNSHQVNEQINDEIAHKMNIYIHKFAFYV